MSDRPCIDIPCPPVTVKRLLIVPLLIALVACGDPWEGEGVIVDRNYDDPDTWTMPGYFTGGTTSCSTINGTTTCRTSPLIWHPPITFHDGPHWQFTLRDAEGKKHKKGVSQHSFDTCLDGWSYNTETEECKAR